MLVCGVDVIEVARIERALARRGPCFLARVYTPLEAAVSRGRASELAARFAAKEAVSKALGVGMFNNDSIFWRDVEILPDRRGRPVVYLTGRARRRADEMGIRDVAVSLSHDAGLAIAMVVGECEGDCEAFDATEWRRNLETWVREKRLPNSPGGSGPARDTA